MTPPADLASLRGLVRALEQYKEEVEGNARTEEYNAENRALGGALGPSAPPRWQAREHLLATLPAAREALERVESTCSSCEGDKAELQGDIRRGRERADAYIARFESALLKYGQHGPQCPVWATMTRGTCTCGLDAALEGR